METAWMGRYRPLVAALVRHGNSVARTLAVRYPMLGGIALNQQEWQILEYLLEHEQDEVCMCRISERLGIPQSSLSKAVKNLCRLGLVERYRRGQNRKNVILHATPLGRELYLDHVPGMRAACFDRFFEALEEMDDAGIAAMAKAVELLTGNLTRGSEQPEPVPMDPPDQI